MISERTFVAVNTSFWRELMPTGESYIRRQNLQLARFDQPMESNAQAERQALISELAFRFFRFSVSNNLNLANPLPDSIFKELSQETVRFLSRFGEYSSNEIPEPIDLEKREAIEIARRLEKFFRLQASGEKIICPPIFNGCGVLDACEGDVIVKRSLYEVKAVDRSFRLNDLRQLLVYCALNHASLSYEIDNIGLLNPRSGVSFEASVEKVVNSVSGSSAVELFSSIVEFACRSRTSN